MAAALALGASLAWGVADYLGGLKSRTLAVLSVLALSQPVGLLAIATAVAVRGNGPPGREVLWAPLAAVCGTAGLAAFYRGMASGAMSVVAPIAATSAVIPIGIGLATGDRPSVLQELGFALALAGVVLVSRETGGSAGRSRVAAGVGWALIAALGFGGYYVPMHAASAGDFLWAAFAFRAASTSIVLLCWLALRPPLGAAGRQLGALAAIGVLDTGGNVLFAAASTRGLVSVVSVLAALYPVTTVALARLYLRERVGPVQQAGVATALAGVILISTG